MAKREEFEKKNQRRTVRYFSESFKVQKVQEIERNLVTVRELSKEYSVTTTAVYKWLDKYSVNNKRKVRQIIEPMSDAKKINELRQRIKELEQKVGQKQIELEFKDKMIELAEQMYQIDIKKKLGSKQSSGSGLDETHTPGR